MKYLIWASLASVIFAVSIFATQRNFFNNFLYRTSARNEGCVTGFRFEIATTTKAQVRGLGGRINIPNDYGMLFVFKKKEKYGFWMKDMLTPIDIIWLSDTGSVLGVEGSVSTSTYPNVFYSPRPVRYVLETRAGFARARGLDTGSCVTLPLPYGK